MIIKVFFIALQVQNRCLTHHSIHFISPPAGDPSQATEPCCGVYAASAWGRGGEAGLTLTAHHAIGRETAVGGVRGHTRGYRTHAARSE